MATEIIVTDQFADWYRSLDEQDADAVEFSVGLLEQFGVALGASHSSRIRGTALRELRIQSGPCAPSTRSIVRAKRYY
jgi:hypothetical protein